jgi:hypothetical protein
LICAAPGAKYRIIFCQDMRLTKNSSQASNVRPLRGRALQTPAFFIGFHAPQAHENEQSALALLVLGVLADDHDFALALDDLALLAHGLDRRSDFHVDNLLICFSR